MQLPLDDLFADVCTGLSCGAGLQRDLWPYPGLLGRLVYRHSVPVPYPACTQPEKVWMLCVVASSSWTSTTAVRAVQTALQQRAAGAVAALAPRLSAGGKLRMSQDGAAGVETVTSRLSPHQLERSSLSSTIQH